MCQIFTFAVNENDFWQANPNFQQSVIPGSRFPSIATQVWIFYSVTLTETCSGYWIKYSNQCCVRRKPWTWRSTRNRMQTTNFIPSLIFYQIYIYNFFCIISEASKTSHLEVVSVWYRMRWRHSGIITPSVWQPCLAMRKQMLFLILYFRYYFKC
jgi:hypothetical protein